MSETPVSLLELFEDEFFDMWPLDPTDYAEFSTSWTFSVSQGVGVLRVVLDSHGLDSEEFEWTLNLRS